LEQLRDKERLVFAEGSIVEDEQELDAGFEGLDRMWNAGWEEPDVA